MDDPRLPAIQRLSEPLLAQDAAEIVELSVKRQGGQVVVRLLVDKVGGVTIQDCARLNKRIGQALEEAALLEERYTIEVSSPGLDRPLVSRRDFERAIGEDLELQVVADGQPAKPLSGMLLSVQEEAIVVTTGSGNVTIPLGQVRDAHKAIKF